jgi:hypothetical protein
VKACSVDDTADAGLPQVEDRWLRGWLPVNGLRNTFWRRSAAFGDVGAAFGDVVVDERQRLMTILVDGIKDLCQIISETHLVALHIH